MCMMTLQKRGFVKIGLFDHKRDLYGMNIF